eukprot:3053923-Prymnesium_polylepis.2
MRGCRVGQPRELVRGLRAKENLAGMCCRRPLQLVKVIARVPVVSDACRVRGGGAAHVQQRARPLLNRIFLIVKAQQRHGRVVPGRCTLLESRPEEIGDE